MLGAIILIALTLTAVLKFRIGATIEDFLLTILGYIILAASRVAVATMEVLSSIIIRAIELASA